MQEYYGDYQAVDPYHFTLNAKTNYAAYLPLSSESSGVQQLCARSVEAITAVFLSLKKRPLIRYQKTSDISRKIAQDAGVGPSALEDLRVVEWGLILACSCFREQKVMYEEEKPLFDFRRTDSAPLLLVIDRRDDPVSPLLNQWTYQVLPPSLPCCRLLQACPHPLSAAGHGARAHRHQREPRRSEARAEHISGAAGGGQAGAGWLPGDLSDAGKGRRRWCSLLSKTRLLSGTCTTTLATWGPTLPPWWGSCSRRTGKTRRSSPWVPL